MNETYEVLLYTMASQFRKALVSAIRSGDIRNLYWKSFPKGCCDGACNMLQRYFIENNVETLIVSGRFENSKYGHSWLETPKGIVIDITGDQFVNTRHHFEQDVYVGARDNGFYDTFVNLSKHSYREYDAPFLDPNRQEYEIVKRYLS